MMALLASERWPGFAGIRTIVEGDAKFAGRSSLRTWLFAVIRNTAGSRRARRSLETLARIAAFPPHAEPFVTPAMPAENARVLDALRALPKRQYEVLDLAFYRNLSIAEAAEVLGISIGTARMHNQLVIGGAVAGRPIYGHYPLPGIDGPENVGGGRMILAVSCDQYAATLAAWFGVPDAALAGVAPHIDNFAQRDPGLFA